MADKKLSQLTALTGAGTASGDLLYIVDVSEPVAADQSKKITLTEFQAAPVSAGTANAVLFLDGSKVPTTSTALTWNGTTLATTGALTVNGNTTLGNASTDIVTVNGYMGVGGASDSRFGVYVSSTSLTSTTQEGIVAAPRATVDSTVFVSAIRANVGTVAASFTTLDAYGVRIQDASKGAGSTINRLHGLYIADQTQGTNNYGITSLVSSGTDKWNIYASGTAANYFAGNVGIGTSTPATQLDILSGSTSTLRLSNSDTILSLDQITGEISFYQADATGGGTGVSGRIGMRSSNRPDSGTYFGNSADMAFFVSGGVLGNASDNAPYEALTIRANGNVGIGTSTPSVKLQVNGAGTSGTSENIAIFNGGDSGVIGSGAKIYLTGSSTAPTARAAMIEGVNVGGSGNGHALVFYQSPNGTSPTERLRISPAEAVFNDPGNDYDFRVESDTNTHALFVEGSSGNVGIGTSSPVGKLDVSATIYSRILNITAPTLDNDTHAGEALYLRSGGTAGDQNVQAVLAFGKADSSSQRSGAAIASIQTTSDTDQIGLAFYISSSTSSIQTMSERFRIGTSEVVVNEQSADYDFRVESDTNTHALFVDAENSRVGVNNSAPSFALDLKAASNEQMRIDGTSATDTTFLMDYNGGGATNRIRLLNKAGDFAVNTNNTEECFRAVQTGRYLRLASGTGGIQFNGDTAADNALDDYEEGTFTPTIVGLTTAGTGTYTTQVGRYTKIGNRVIFNVVISWSAHTGTGNMEISGLPFTSNSASGNFNAASIYSTDLAFSDQLAAYVASGATSVSLITISNNAPAVVLALDTAAGVRVAGTYTV